MKSETIRAKVELWEGRFASYTVLSDKLGRMIAHFDAKDDPHALWIQHNASPDAVHEALAQVRAELQSGDTSRAAELIERFEQNCQYVAQLLSAWDAGAQKRRGSQGGATPKRKAWAEALAVELAARHPGATKEAIWRSIPDGPPALEIEAWGETIEVYRDGSRLEAMVNDIADKLAEATFKKRYLRPGR